MTDALSEAQPTPLELAQLIVSEHEQMPHWKQDAALPVLAREVMALTAQLAACREALSDLVAEPLRYNDNRIEIDCASHAAAMGRVRRARAALEPGKK